MCKNLYLKYDIIQITRKLKLARGWIHHLFQQHICKENDEFFDAVNDEKNLIFLCPTCHKKIHYGQKDVVRKMLATLYNREKKFYDSYFANYLGSMDVLEWLYKIYKVSEEK